MGASAVVLLDSSWEQEKTMQTTLLMVPEIVPVMILPKPFFGAVAVPVTASISNLFFDTNSATTSLVFLSVTLSLYMGASAVPVLLASEQQEKTVQKTLLMVPEMVPVMILPKPFFGALAV